MKRNLLTALLIPALAALFPGCEKAGSTTRPDPADSLFLGELAAFRHYVMEDGKVRFPSRVLERLDCEDGKQVTRLDTTADEYLNHELDADRLTVGKHETVDGDARILHRETLERVGKGSGLPGTWKMRDVDYVVLSGTPSGEAKAYLDSRVSQSRNELIDNPQYYVFSDSVFRIYVNMAAAARFREAWYADTTGDGNAARFDIEVTVVDRFTVRLIGGKSGERVTIRIYMDSGDEYSSSDSAHGKYRYNEADPDCAQGHRPDWYGTFLNDNAKVSPG